jgi:predicted nuclease with TOPRIM domain
MDKILLLIGLIVGSIATWLITNNRTNARNRLNQERIKQALFQFKTRFDELEARLQKEQQERSSHLLEPSALQNQLETANQERSRLYTQLSQLQSQFETANQESVRRYSQWSNLQTQLETANQEREQLHSQLSELQTQLGKY